MNLHETGEMLNVFFRKVAKTGEMLNMLNVWPFQTPPISPKTFNIFNIFNISPVLATFRKKHLTFPLFREPRVHETGEMLNVFFPGEMLNKTFPQKHLTYLTYLTFPLF